MCVNSPEKYCSDVTDLYDEGGSTEHDLLRDLGERAVLDAHDLQVGAERQLEGEVVQVRVVIDVQLLQLLQRTCEPPPKVTCHFCS